MFRTMFHLLTYVLLLHPAVSQKYPATSQSPVSTTSPILAGSAELRVFPIGCEKSATAYAGVQRSARDGNYELPIDFKIVGQCRFPQLSVRYYGLDTNSFYQETITVNLVKRNEKIPVTVCHYISSSQSNMPSRSVATNVATETDECPVYGPLSEYIRNPRRISFIASVQSGTSLSAGRGFQYDGVLYGVFLAMTVTCPKKRPPPSNWRYDRRGIITKRKPSVTVTNGVPWDDAELDQPFKFRVRRRYRCVDPKLSVDFLELDHNSGGEKLTISVSGQQINQCNGVQCKKTWKNCVSDYNLTGIVGKSVTSVTVNVHRPSMVNFCEDYKQDVNGQLVTFYTWVNVTVSCGKVKRRRRGRREFDDLWDNVIGTGRYFAAESTTDGETGFISREWKLFAGVLVIGLVLVLGVGYIAAGGIFSSKKDGGEYSPLLPDVAEGETQRV